MSRTNATIDVDPCDAVDDLHDGTSSVPGSRLRVAYVTMQFPAPSEAFAGTDVRVLHESGVDVEVYAMRPRRADADELLRQRGLAPVRTSSLTTATFFRACLLLVTRPLWWLTLLAWIVRWQYRRPKALLRCLVLSPSAVAIFDRIHSREVDVVHLFWGHYPSMIGHLVQRFAPEVVCSMFLGAYDLQEGQYGSWVPGSVPVARRADLVFTHSVSNVGRLLSFGIRDDRLHCVYRGVDLRAFPLDEHREEVARTPGRIVSIGSLIERKAMDHVLRVLALVRSVHPQAHVRILGDGPERTSLEALARSLGLGEAVMFVGHVSGAEVATELSQAAAFTLLSKSDRIPNVVKEAMASGCPCVVSHTQGMEELIDHHRTGYLVDVGDVESAAEYLASILGAPQEHRAMVRAARKHVAEHFSAEASMSAYRAAWSDVSSTKASLRQASA